jgi:hypothetical protein
VLGEDAGDGVDDAWLIWAGQREDVVVDHFGFFDGVGGFC